MATTVMNNNNEDITTPTSQEAEADTGTETTTTNDNNDNDNEDNEDETPDNANVECVGPTSATAGKSSACVPLILPPRKQKPKSKQRN